MIKINRTVQLNIFANSIDLKNCTMKVLDGSTTPNEITVKIGDGNLTYTERQNREYEMDRDTLDTVKNGPETPLEVAFDFRWDFIIPTTGSGTPTVEEALKKTGEAAAWTSTDSDSCAPYAVDLQFENDPDCGGQREIITFPDFRYEEISHDARNGTISVTGKCNVTSPNIVRQT